MKQITFWLSIVLFIVFLVLTGAFAFTDAFGTTIEVTSMEQQLLDLQQQMLYIAIAAVIAPIVILVLGYIFGISKANIKILEQLKSNKDLIEANMNNNQTLILSEIKHINQNIAEIKTDVHTLEDFRVAANEEFMTKGDCTSKMILLSKGN